MLSHGYVYRWDNVINGKSYIGSHNGKKKDYVGSGLAFTRAWKKYPEDCWERTILYRGTDFRNKETEHIVRSNALDSDLYYNLMHCTEGYCEHSEETKLKISSSLKGQEFSPERCSNISKGLAGKSRPSLTEEHKAKLSIVRAGSTFSPEWRANIGAARRGVSPPAETRAKISKTMTGVPHERVECPTCRKLVGIRHMKRHESRCQK